MTHPLTTSNQEMLAHLKMFPGSGGGDDGVKRELIESCPDFPGILDQEDENEDKPGQIKRYSSMGELISEKEEAGKEEIKDIMAKADQRKKRRQSQKKNESNIDDEEREQYKGNSGDGVDWRELGRKKKSCHPFRCPDNNCGETFAKEVKSPFVAYFVVIYIFILRCPRFHIFFSIIRMNMQRLVIESNIKRLLVIRC